MADNLERTQDRLDNVRSVEPLLGALRTISLGAWQASLNRMTGVEAYEEQFLKVMSYLLPHLPHVKVPAEKETPDQKQGKRIILVIGSERGLCGGFNAVLSDYVSNHLEEWKQAGGGPLRLWVLGNRAKRILRQAGRIISWSRALPGTSVPDYELAYALTQEWLEAYERREIESLDVISNRYLGAGRYKAELLRLIPPDPGSLTHQSMDLSEAWPPPIIQTDQVRLYARAIRQMIAFMLYQRLLESIAAEHSARYQLMEEAGKNAERLLEELMVTVQAARRQAITREMQELAVSSNLLPEEGGND